VGLVMRHRPGSISGVVGGRHTFVDEAEGGGKAGVVGMPVVSMKLDDEASLGRVEATLTAVGQVTTQLHAGRLRLSDLRPLQVEEETNVVSTPDT